MCDGGRGQSESVDVDVLAWHDVGIPSHLTGGAFADSGGERGATPSAAAPTPLELLNVWDMPVPALPPLQPPRPPPPPAESTCHGLGAVLIFRLECRSRFALNRVVDEYGGTRRGPLSLPLYSSTFRFNTNLLLHSSPNSVKTTPRTFIHISIQREPTPSKPKHQTHAMDLRWFRCCFGWNGGAGLRSIEMWMKYGGS